MREQLIAYIDKLFVGTDESQAARDCRDELLQNTLDRYEEELAAGKTAEEAYRLAVLSIPSGKTPLRCAGSQSRCTARPWCRSSCSGCLAQSLRHSESR